MKTMTKMNTILIAIAFFGLQFSPLFAGNSVENFPAPDKNKRVCLECLFLSPHPPATAPYDDQNELQSWVETQTLKPQIPQEASFSDSMDPAGNEKDSCLKPSVPLEASFTPQL